EKYANVLPTPNSSTPGFKRPKMAMFQYFKGKVSDFKDRAAKEITSEELHAYYEKNKDIRYRERKPPVTDGGADETKSPETSAEGTQSENGKSGDASGGDAKPSDDGQKSSETEGDKKPAPAAAGGKKSSRTVPASSLRLVALAQKADDKPAPADGTSKAADTTVADKPTDTPAEEKPAADAATETSDGAAPPADTAAAEKPSEKQKEATYEPFEKVEEEIRSTLAGEKAGSLIRDTFDRVGRKIREYGRARSSYEAHKGEDKDLTPPEELDVPALVSGEPLEPHETSLISADEAVANTDLGKSFTEPLPGRNGWQSVPFVEIGFPDRLYNPEPTEDNDGNVYLSWKVQETPEGVPDFDEVRKEVIRALKLVEARKLALAEAEKLAKETRKAEKPLIELFAGREGIEVVDTGAFTWMTIGNVPFDPTANQPHLSPVHGVEAPGKEFMDAVFDSSPDQVRVAMNEPKTIAYVIRVKGFEPPRDELQHEFLLDDFRKYAPLAMEGQQDGYLGWIRWLEQQAGVTWLQPGIPNRRGDN
ncbi:MAG TPA: hypothetical protein VMF30_18695, partial [Pirellulales bacterium]|nr:hypothetical protein [Pirellulales bacterium]